MNRRRCCRCRSRACLHSPTLDKCAAFGYTEKKRDSSRPNAAKTNGKAAQAMRKYVLLLLLLPHSCWRRPARPTPPTGACRPTRPPTPSPRRRSPIKRRRSTSGLSDRHHQGRLCAGRRPHRRSQRQIRRNRRRRSDREGARQLHVLGREKALQHQAQLKKRRARDGPREKVVPAGEPVRQDRCCGTSCPTTSRPKSGWTTSRRANSRIVPQRRVPRLLSADRGGGNRRNARGSARRRQRVPAGIRAVSRVQQPDFLLHALLRPAPRLQRPHRPPPPRSSGG